MRISLGEYRIDASIYVFGVFFLGFVKVRFNKVRSHLRSGYEPVSKEGLAWFYSYLFISSHIAYGSGECSLRMSFFFLSAPQ